MNLGLVQLSIENLKAHATHLRGTTLPENIKIADSIDLLIESIDEMQQIASITARRIDAMIEKPR